MLRILVCLVVGAVGCGGGSANDDAFTDFVTVDEALIDLGCFPIQLPLDAGECATPLATLDELALTPRCWPPSGTDAWGFSSIEWLEVLAARVSSRVVAEPVVYERILRDMAALRAMSASRRAPTSGTTSSKKPAATAPAAASITPTTTS